jgi:histone acetyltransferase (RNA polymerase elongator complex component)
MINAGSTQRPFIIPVFLPHAGCPHQCVFCNQTSITGTPRDILSMEKVEINIHEFLKYKRDYHRFAQVAFYGGNFLGLDKDHIKGLLNVSIKFVKNKDIDSIRFSTRPDTIDTDRLDIIKDYPVSTIEIGAQSMDDRVLAEAKRGHLASDTQRAAALLKERHYETGIQMMVGLPGENEESSLSTGHRIEELAPDFVRIYPAVVLKDSLLAKWYRNGRYRPWSLERSVAQVKKLYLLFKNKGIRVIRMGLQAAEDLDSGAAILAGPYHPAFGHMVHSEIFLDMAVSVMKAERISQDAAVLKVHPRSISKMRGLNNKNVDILKKIFHIQSIQIVPDPSISEYKLALDI